MSESLARQILAAKSTKRDTKLLIYQHALELFAAKGYAGTSLRDIARSVGVEVPTLYGHIEAKSALLFDLMDYGTRDLLRRLESTVQAASNYPPTQLFALVRDHVATNCRNQNQTLVVFNEIRQLTPEQRSQILPLREKIEALYFTCIERGIATGSMRPVNVRLTVYGILSMGRGVATWYRPDGALSPEALAEEYADLTLRGVLGASLLGELGDE